MCSTIATGIGKSAGKRGISTLSACGPPVEMPINEDVGCATRECATFDAAGGGVATAAATRHICAPAAALTLATSSSATSSSRSVASAVGF